LVLGLASGWLVGLGAARRCGASARRVGLALGGVASDALVGRVGGPREGLAGGRRLAVGVAVALAGPLGREVLAELGVG
jgi:hypothetical protein